MNVHFNLGANPEQQIPFCADKYLDYQKFAIHMPLQRITELHFILKSISSLEILEMKRKGRNFYINHAATFDGLINS